MPTGVCCTRIDFEIDDAGCLHELAFTNGCPGNAQGIARLAKGMSAAEIVTLFKDIKCGRKSTSCPAQLAKALAEELERRKDR